MEKEGPAAAAPANSPALPLSSQRHLLVAADTWMPWFSIQESDDGSRSYTGIMWEARAKKAILLFCILFLVLHRVLYPLPPEFQVVGHLSRSLNFTFEIVSQL